MVFVPRADAVLRHQYTFNTAAPVGGTFEDLVGNADGTLFGTASVSGGNTGQLILPGGGSGETGNHAALLPNGVDGININTYTNVTFSLWATWNGGGVWQRYLDFGGHSISAPANGGNTIFMTPDAGGGEPSGIRLALSNVDLNTQSGFNNEQSISAANPAPVGAERHVVGVFDGASDQMRIYVNGIQVAQNAAPVTHMLSLLQTDAAFLGAALYNDPNFAGSINQFEIYDTALTGAEVVNLFVAGKVGEAATPVPLLTVNRDTGAMTLSNGSSPIQVLGYSITSAAGSLNSVNWRTIADNFDADSGTQFDNDDVWTVLSAAGSKSDFSEFAFDTTPGNGGVLGPSFSPQLGNNGAWRKSIYEDLQAQLKLVDGSTVDVVVSYTGNGGAAFNRSDLNFDGNITGADWLLFRTNNLVDLSTFSLAETYAKGDLDGDRDNDFDDFLLFKADYDGANGAGAFAAMVAAVPEPSTFVVLAAAVVISAAGCRRRSTRSFSSMINNNSRGRCIGPKRAYAALAAGVATMLLVAAPADAALRHRWTFNDGNANDSVGTANGTLQGATTSLGRAVLAGGTEHVDLPGPTIAINTYSALTLEMWLTSSTANTGYTMAAVLGRTYDVNLGEPDWAGYQYVMIQPTRAAGPNASRAAITAVRFEEESGVNGPSQINDNKSHHLAVTVDNSEIAYYVDGSLIGSAPVGANTLSSLSNNLAYLGRSVYQFDPNFVGSIDEFRIHDNVLSPNQIADSTYFGPAPADLLALEVNKSTGQVTLKNNHSAALAIDHYSIVSRGGALNNAWSGLGSLDSVGAGEGQSWAKAGGADVNELAELFLTGSSTFDPAESHSLGTAYNPAVFGAANGDLVFQYHLTSGERLYGPVTYVDAACISGDFSCSGSVGNDDLTLLLDNWGDAVPPTPAGWNGTPPTAPAVGNDELTLLLDGWGDIAGAGSVGAASVPEPATWLFAAGAAAAGLVSRRRRTRVTPHQGSLSMTLRISQTVRIAAALLLLVTLATTASAATKDRFYQFGDDTVENPVLDQTPQTDFGALTADSAAIGPNDFSDLSYATGPVYVNTNALARPGSAAGEWGLTFNGTDNSLVRTNGSLGSPAIGDDEGAYAGNPNYTGITTRLMEGWVRPTNATLGRQDIVNDSTQFSIFISADDRWGFTHGGTTITSATNAAFNAWTHVMHQTFTNTAGVLLVNGVAVAATPNDYDAGFNPATTAKNLTFGANVDQNANFFAGQLDNFSFYVAGNNSTQTNGANWGDVNLATDNDYIRQQMTGKPAGDANLDGVLNPTDVTWFVTNWLSTKQVNGVTVGDLTTRGKGDFDFNGVVNLDDAFTLHQALLGAGAGGLDFSLLGASVPEPGSLLLAACGGAALVCGSRRRRN